MKKVTCCSLVAVFFTFATMDILAQKSTMLAKLDIIIPHMERFSNTNDLKELRRNDVSIRAQRNFMKQYKNVADARWVISGNGLLAAYFTEAGITCRRYYNRKGVYEYMIRYYKEDKLHRSIRHLVRSQYYDFTISQVTEVSRSGNVAYFIDLEDKVSWKTIRVFDNEMEVVDEFLKSL
jgi:hypothetical protein